jgi:L-seryl-tRNA(Ser) seleniumtransferase
MADYRIIPSIEQLRQRSTVRALESRFGHALVIDALRAETDVVRRSIATAKADSPRDSESASVAIERGVATRIETLAGASLRGVINATGVIIHTNLGRAPLSKLAAERVADLSSGYTNLEFDLREGGRGARDTHAEALLCRLTGAEAAVVANNNAAATMLILAALAAGREVLISRGELVEIGGGFRVPDVMAQSGAILREVGTTNRTRVGDYAAAITDRTGLILRVHPSNFQITGFTERPALADLVALGERFSIPVAEDLGSGYLGPAGGLPVITGEPDVRASVSAGVDLACFSGDKLLGGPQAGLVVGKRDPLSRVRKHPLMRALRVDKMTYAALEATLQSYATGRATEEIPVARMLAATRDEIAARANVLAEKLRASGYDAVVIDGMSTIGGGSAPGSQLPTALVAITPASGNSDALAAALRRGDPPIVARIEDDRVVLDLRTVNVEDDGTLERVLGSGVLGFWGSRF